MGDLLPILYPILMLGVVVGLATHYIFLSRLRARHPAAWNELGKPTLFINNSIANGIAVQRFIWRRDYRKLGDPSLSKLADFLRTFQLCYLIFFGFLLV